MTLDAQTIANVVMPVFTVISGTWLGFERWRSAKATDRERIATEQATKANAQQAANEELLKAKDRTIETVNKYADDIKRRADEEHAEYVTYRTESHDRVKTVQAEILTLAADNAALQAKTDLTPILNFSKQQIETNDKIVAQLEKGAKAFDLILTRLEELKPVNT